MQVLFLNRKLLYCVLFWPVALVLFTAVGCNSLDAAKEELLRALQKMSEVESYRHSHIAAVYGSDGIQLIHSEEEFASPDYWHSKVITDSGERESIKAGNASYIRVDGGDWQECTEEGPWSCELTTVDNGLDYLHYIELEEVQEKDLIIDGTECMYYRGRVDVDSWVKDFDEAPPSDEIDSELYEEYQAQISQYEMTVQLWIDRNNYINQLKLDIFFPYDDPETGERKWGSSISISKYSLFNKNILIMEPILEKEGN